MNKILKTAVFTIIALVVVACAHDDTQKLLGEWSGVDAHDNHQTFIFNADNTVTWIIAAAGTLNVDYRFDSDTSPYQLDLLGFNTPPLENKTLFGIIEFMGNNSFRFDCEAGQSDQNGEKFRPASFTKDTVTYTRTR